MRSAAGGGGGAGRYPQRGLLITADGGGTNGYRYRLWKANWGWPTRRALITVCHFPPGTSKWNKIEHRLFLPLDYPPHPPPIIPDYSGTTTG